MYFGDLSPCSYGILEPSGVSVGWLDKVHIFPRGAVPDGFVGRLIEICRTPAVRHRGFHVCELCDFSGLEDYERAKAADALSSTVIRVVDHDGRVYYSPKMICHYVTKHGYKPPEEFVSAVMADLSTSGNRP